MSQNPIPEHFEIDFCEAKRDLVMNALDRMLSQHYMKAGLRQLVLALVGEVQCLYGTLVEVQQKRTLYEAEGYVLDAIGRIVGEERKTWHYNQDAYMFADRERQRCDFVPCWTVNAPLAKFVMQDDESYKYNILARIIKNHTLCSSVPELQHFFQFAFGKNVSFLKTGPYQCSLQVPADLAPALYAILTQPFTDERVDDAFYFPYPATLWFSSIIVDPGDTEDWSKRWFCADRTNVQRCDRAPCAVGIPLYNPGPDGGYIDPEGNPGGNGVTIYTPENWFCADRTNAQRSDRAECAAGIPIPNP